MRPGKPHTKIGSGNLRSQSDKDREAKEALSKSGPGQKARALKTTRAAEQAEMASFKLNRRAKF